MIVIAIVGNAAEHWVAVLVALKNKMDLAVNIAIGSSAQVALFVAPVLVLASFFIGPYPLALVFNGFELGAILIAILIANYVTQDGESTWFEGCSCWLSTSCSGWLSISRGSPGGIASLPGWKQPSFLH